MTTEIPTRTLFDIEIGGSNALLRYSTGNPTQPPHYYQAEMLARNGSFQMDCPALAITTYGSTKEEAKQAFHREIECLLLEPLPWKRLPHMLNPSQVGGLPLGVGAHGPVIKPEANASHS